MSKHPFPPEIPSNARKLLIGTLPPEGASFYFSNDSNTRLWDFLTAIRNKSSIVGKGGYELSKDEKINILKDLHLGNSDIILEYERDEIGKKGGKDSLQDIHIIPKKYNDLIQLAIDNNIDEFIFLYESAYKWFLHSIKKEQPLRLKEIKGKYTIGFQEDIKIGDKTIKCVLLPNPLNRGRKGETKEVKLEMYRKHIIG